MADVAAPVFKKRTNKANLRKRPATAPPEDQSASESDYTDDEGGVRVKRRKREGVTTSNTGPRRAQDLSKSTAFAADRTTTLSANDDATKASNWYTDAALAAKDAGANAKQGKDAAETAAEREQGTYQGTAQYSTFISKNPDARQMGPVKAPTNVRTITVTDFAPDVCKDYKQTGFCGFGDSCKFLHAREDYKQGWQLDKEWESVGSKKKKAGADGKGGDDDMDEEEKMLEKIPFACVICKEGYKNPVVTKCGHYFCEKCAMGRYMKEKKKSCAACGADTNGSFGVARKLKDLLEKKKKRKKERKAKMREAGEEVSEDEG
ncbi:unnamed protein product [Zymoseptoria tritici ST99CH_1E4]|uniref:Pre-mRNA-splicing factor CWC24 n=1 Tax=Zymoseptoria tritici ST99CH_1E4 TaxID=1276532 RepID=A0A2H1G4X6_ZYMTR|nr:unnamed protein product [Zymoseptoria tritici ST99CH_1E4]